MLKVMTIVGTRPEIIKLSRVIAKLDLFMEHLLVHTGQNYDYELNQVFFDEMGIRKPDYFLDVANDTPASTIANIIQKSDELFACVKPDALLIYGDTNSCLCVLPAKRRKIPIFHMEAGNRCFDQRVPEEINRKVVDHLSDINMPLTEHARNYLVQEGIPYNRIIKTGSCMKEVFEYYNKNIDNSDILETLKLEKRKYILVSIHREENLDIEENFENLPKIINAMAKKYNIPIIFSTHPRTMKKLKLLKDGVFSPLVLIHNAFGFFDYIQLQKNAFCTVSDSGTITEESAILNFPAITIRFAHERPEGMDEGIVTMSNMCEKRVLGSIEIAVQKKTKVLPQDYNVDNVSDKVINTIQSYTDYINQNIWKKY